MNARGIGLSIGYGHLAIPAEKGERLPWRPLPTTRGRQLRLRGQRSAAGGSCISTLHRREPPLWGTAYFGMEL